MLVCNVSQSRRRASIAADVAETAEASDAATTGNVVFATLVDDPASVRDSVDAYLGEIMVEAAAANDTIDAGMFYAVAVVEETTAADTSSASTYVPGVVVADVAETASADSAQDAVKVSARSAMIAGLWPVYVNPSTARQAYVGGVMVNL
jgi:hypothetical protein